MAREDDKLPSVVVVLIGLICVYISLTPVFGNHILIYGGCFLVRKIKMIDTNDFPIILQISS